VLGPNAFLVLPILLTVSLPETSGLLAYGPAPGLELIPYFLSLVAWAGLAFAAILLAPLSALLRRIRRRREKVDPNPAPSAVSPSRARSAAE
jgi:hypothetical protein